MLNLWATCCLCVAGLRRRAPGRDRITAAVLRHAQPRVGIHLRGPAARQPHGGQQAGGVHVQCRALTAFADSPTALPEYVPRAPVHEEWGTSFSGADSVAADAPQKSAPAGAECGEDAAAASNGIPQWAKCWKGWRLSCRATTPEAPNRAHARESVAAKLARCRLGAALPGRRIMRHTVYWREVCQPCQDEQQACRSAHHCDLKKTRFAAAKALPCGKGVGGSHPS